MTSADPKDDAARLAEQLAKDAIIADIRHRLRDGPLRVGADRRALPPVDDAARAAQSKLDQAWYAADEIHYDRE